MKLSVGIIGGGVVGLVAGYELSKAGAKVIVLERDERLGGLASSFAAGPSCEIEKYYHFICKPDKAYLNLLSELSLSSRLRWMVTEMGIFHNDALYTIGDLASLLAFPYLSILDKMRFVHSTLLIKFARPNSWKALENIQAQEWLIKRYGQRTYEILYGPLLNLKFREYAPLVSAAWMWARFYRLGNSRTIAQKEQLGYLEGGTQVFIDKLQSVLHEHNAELRTRAPAERIVIEGGGVTGIKCRGKLLPFDCILSTVPIPYFTELLADVRDPYFDNLRGLQYIGVRTMVMRLRRKFCKYFWTNISDPEINLAGIIEYTNLNALPQLEGDALLYLPQYLASGHPFYEMTNQDLFVLYCQYLHKINPSFERGWVQGYWVHCDRFAQPICDLSFSARNPSMQTPIRGLCLTDSYQLHPYDRTISGSIDLGKKVAQLILTQHAST